MDLAEVLELLDGRAADEALAVEPPPACHLDLERLGQRVHHRDADAVQAAGRVIDLGVELPAGMKGGHDHLQRRLRLELRVRVDRDAAAVVGDGDEAVLLDLDVDPARVAGHRLVHAVVDHLGKEVMEPLLVGAADIHAGPAPHRLQPFEHLDVGGRVIGVGQGKAVHHLLRRDGLLGARRLGNGLQAPDLLVEIGEQVFGRLLLGGFHGGHGSWVLEATN